MSVLVAMYTVSAGSYVYFKCR